MDMNKSMDFFYEKSEIPAELIAKCELLVDNETLFIFNNIDDKIRLVRADRDDKLEIILDEEEKDTSIYYIGSVEEFDVLPSRFSYYDTETKMTNIYDKHRLVTDFILNLGTEESISNFGISYEQSYILEADNKRLIIRVSPNLFIKIEMYGDVIGVIYKDFFNREKIYEALSKNIDMKQIIRESKIENILN
jgi:hypothetical protein